MVDQRRFGIVTHDLLHEYEDKQRQKAQAGSSTVVLPDKDKFPWFKLPKEKNFIKVDILPFVAATENGPVPLSRFNYHIHRNIGPGYASVVCPQQQSGLPCPICEYVRGLDWNDPQDQELRKKYRPQQRQLYALRWLDGPEEVRNKIHIFDTSEYGFGRILDEKIQKRDATDPQESGWTQYADLLEGWTLKLDLCEQSFGGSNTYTAVSAINFKPRVEQYSEEWYDKVPDLSQCVVLLSYDEIKQKFESDALSTSSSSSSTTPNVTERVINAVNSYDLTNGFNPLVPSVAIPSPTSQAPILTSTNAMAVDDDPF